MHQPVDVDPTSINLLLELEQLAERFDGSICLRRYGKKTLICDTKMRELADAEERQGYRVFTDPAWAVSSGRGKILGAGKTPGAAIHAAYGNQMKWRR